ncbi:MAG: trypsin-like peptidase domain-containing protein [Gemmatimonadales bacterium]
MKAQLKALSGHIAGQIAVFSKSAIDIGRHPSTDLQFDPARDLQVSGRHARIVREGNRWILRDLKSLNGTFVNGHRISNDTTLDDTDQIQFGANGPVLEFRLVPEDAADGILEPARAPAQPPGQHLLETAETRKPRPTAADGRAPHLSRPPGTTKRLRVELGKQSRRIRYLTAAVVLIVVGSVAAFMFQNARQKGIRAREVAAIEARTDSILEANSEAMSVLQGQVRGLATALDESQEAVSELRNALVTAQQAGNSQEVAALRKRLADASQALLYRQAAAYVDYRGIVEANQSATALLWVEFAPGEVFTGTAFAVRPDGTMLTARHVVTGENGDRNPTRLAIKFADSYQVYPATIVSVATDADLVVIRVDVPGGVPTVKGLASSDTDLAPGDPVAVIGFPLGTALPMSKLGDRTVARTSFSAGTVSKVVSGVLQIDGFGTQGASGSPIMNKDGLVVGVLYGGQPGSDGRILLAVPISSALRLLNTSP